MADCGEQMENPIYVVTQSSDVSEYLPEQWQTCESINSLRSGRKKLRDNKPAMVVLCIGGDEDILLGQEIARYIREGMANRDTRIVLLHDPAQQLDEVAWLEEFQINACLTADPARQHFNRSVLNRELDTFSYIENNYRQHDAETEMLVCITRFSRADENITTLLSTFAETLAKLSHAICHFEIYIEMESRYRVRNRDRSKKHLAEQMQAIVVNGQLPACLSMAIAEQKPQINLLHDNGGIDALLARIETPVGSYLTFPIVVYNRVICLLFFLIPEAEMARVSMKQINIINKAAEQLTVLLERKQAESSLKKQYTRLKDTLLELKSTKQALAHNEKLASIGRMAAGIAHEINNPLSFVISNFTSMDSYLDNIIKLQEMQSELLTSIDIQQDQKVTALKQHLAEFEEQAGIEFILEDIRAIVADSFNGLQRVKNIITDLSSFSHNYDGQKDYIDIAIVLSDTLKMLKYDLTDKVIVKQDIRFEKAFYSNAGLMEQVLINLIKNALQALVDAGTEAPEIAISAQETAGGLTLTVRDNGPGMSEAVKAKIYEPFFTTKGVGAGTGLGLSVVYNIVQRLGGMIECESQLGQFTQFTLTFPLAQPEEE